jgi:two-component sensor histidine kinase
MAVFQGRRQADALVRALFEEARDRLVAMARVHDLLSKSEDAQRVNSHLRPRSLRGMAAHHGRGRPYPA